ncbi:MAG: BolA family transcriptional regulator [Hyphomicrobiaceae bacterium]|nr:BolA family transcriptional regulator [Hyphomicrobiaceae bacterium]
MSLEKIISDKLVDAFKPLELQVENESGKHSGHAGDDGSGESHWRIMIIAAAFNGKSRVERQRMINAVLADELKNNIHALAMSVKGVEE